VREVIDGEGQLVAVCAQATRLGTAAQYARVVDQQMQLRVRGTHPCGELLHLRQRGEVAGMEDRAPGARPGDFRGDGLTACLVQPVHDHGGTLGAESAGHHFTEPAGGARDECRLAVHVDDPLRGGALREEQQEHGKNTDQSPALRQHGTSWIRPTDCRGPAP
jgi:hypothetical protein